jgi:predicted dithiol-disulfide oxidoreductase (DUF899 family)
MIQNAIAHPNIAGKDEWLTARKTLLEHEKELTQQRDRINAERRRLPMVKLEKEYTFEGSNGSVRLKDLFEGQTQLIIYHFMFAPEWEKGCGGCTGLVNSLGDLSMLHQRHTTFALVSRAPLPKLEAYKQLKGWTVPWYSSFGSDFNYDFHVTLDENIAPIEYNYRDKAELEKRHGPNVVQGESHGLSVFFRLDDDVFHTYSTYARGVESLTDSYSLLDMTPYGRQEDFEDSPAGWPQKPTYG